MSAGVAKFTSSVCEITTNALLTFFVQTAAGLALNVSTPPFNLTGLASRHAIHCSHAQA